MSKNKKWKKLKSKIIHKNPWYSLREDDVINPNGKKGKYFVVDVNSVDVIAEDSDDKIYLVGQTRYPIGNIYSWEIITGGVKKGLSFLEAAKRELKEEAGLTAKKWINLGYFYPDNGYASSKTAIYLVKDLKKTKLNPDSTENITIKKASLSKIVEMIKSNKITDAHTIISIFKYLLHKKYVQFKDKIKPKFVEKNR